MRSHWFSAWLIEQIFVSLTLAFSVWVVLSQIAILAGFSFRTLALAYTVALFGIAVFVGWLVLTKRLRRSAKGRINDYQVAIAVCSLALACGILSLVAIRPDPDDVNYISSPVYFLANPDQALDLSLHDHAFVDFRTHVPIRLMRTSELFCGYISYVLGCPYLSVYHQYLPFIGGFLIPLAWYLAVSRFSEQPMAALVGTCAIVAYLTMDGTVHRSFGNFAFVRIWQGKALLMSVLVPAFSAFTLDWFDRQGLTYWIRLFLLVVTAAGLTSSAVFLVPLMSLFLAIGYLFSENVSKRRLVRLAGYFLTLSYLVVLGCYLRLVVDRSDYDFIGFQFQSCRFPSSFTGQFKLVFHEWYSFTVITCLAACTASVVLSDKVSRRFLFGWLLSALLIALNPLSMSLMANYLTTNSAYWRLFYILPFPLVIGIAFALLTERARLVRFHSWLFAAALLECAMVFNRLHVRSSPFARASFTMGVYKVDPVLERYTKWIVGLSTPGAMIAPPRFSELIPRYTSKLPQIAVRDFTLIRFATLSGQKELADSRLHAVEFVSGRNDEGYSDLVRLLSLDLKNIVLDERMNRHEELHETLLHHGFRRVVDSVFILYTRQ